MLLPFGQPFAGRHNPLIVPFVRVIDLHLVRKAGAAILDAEADIEGGNGALILEVSESNHARASWSSVRSSSSWAITIGCRRWRSARRSSQNFTPPTTAPPTSAAGAGIARNSAGDTAIKGMAESYRHNVQGSRDGKSQRACAVPAHRRKSRRFLRDRERRRPERPAVNTRNARKSCKRPLSASLRLLTAPIRTSGRLKDAYSAHSSNDRDRERHVRGNRRNDRDS